MTLHGLMQTMTLSQKTVVSLSFAGVCALVWTGWACANFVRDIRDEVRQGVADTRLEIKLLKQDNASRFDALWSTAEQEEWVWMLRDRNYDKGLVIPSVHEVRKAKGK